MFGFSLDQLLMLFAVCFLVLGPKKTVEMAYRLGIQARKVKSYYDSCKKEFGLTDLEAVKNSFCNSSKDMEQKINSMSYELKTAMREDNLQNNKSVSTLKIAKEDNTDVDKEERLCCNDEHTDLEDKELNLRIAALEAELEQARETIAKLESQLETAADLKEGDE